jgi:hypothetical protein
MPADLCRWCGSTYEITQGHTCRPTIATTSTGGDAHDHALDLPGQQRGSSASSGGAHVTGPAGATPPTPAGPPTGKEIPPDPLQQAILAATDALVSASTWKTHRCQWAARVAVEAAWGTLTQPLADLQQSLDYVADPSGWYTEQAAELDRLATFEVAIRTALKAERWDAIGKDEVLGGVGKALADLDRARNARRRKERAAHREVDDG